MSALMRSQGGIGVNEPSPSTSRNQDPSNQPNVASTPTTVKSQPQHQSNVGVVGYVEGHNQPAFQFLSLGNGAGGRQGVNPVILQQASSIQACSLQQTSLVPSTSKPSDQSTSSTTLSSSQSIESPSLTQDVASTGTLQIRRTLNNVNIVNNIGTNFQATAVTPGSIVTSGAGASSAPSSVMLPSVNMGMVGGGIVPFNMVGGMTSTPLLLPQVNGPTLLVNVPTNYMAYQGLGGLPGMLMPGILGTPLVASAPPVLVTSEAVTTSSTTLSSPSSPTVVTSLQSSVASPQPSVTPSESSKIVSVPTDESELNASTSSTEPEPVAGPSHLEPSTVQLCKDQVVEMECDVVNDMEESKISKMEVVLPEPVLLQDEVEDLEEVSVIPESLMINAGQDESQTEYSLSTAALLSPPQLRQRHHSVISHATRQPGTASSSNQISVSTSIHSNQISAIISPRSSNSSTAANTSVSLTTPVTKPGPSTSDTSSDNPPLPQLTLNFPSILMMDNQALSPGSRAGPSSSSSVIVSHNSEAPPSQSPASFSLAGQQPITVDTVEALQTALACDDDVQLVVSNELLETPEFKALMQNMDNSNMMNSIHSTPAVSPSPQVSELDHEDSNLMSRNHDNIEASAPASPVPCSSRDMSRENTRHDMDTTAETLLSLSPGSDDDMSLQDLIAVETIDESQMAEDDINWSSQLSFDSFNYISQVIGNKFVCEKCGLQFNNMAEHRSHIAECNNQVLPVGKSKKSLVSKPKNKTGSSTVTSEDVKVRVPGEHPREISSGLKTEETELEYIETDIKPNILKQEISVATQNPLGAQNKHWKCGQCKVVYESGPQLLEHLDLIKRAKIKCIPCHLVFDDRKDLIAHQRKDHSADLLRLKFDPDSEVIDEPDVVDEKVYVPNALGEYVCDFCDRAFTDKDMLMKHMSCHIEEKPHECLTCGKKFFKANQLREHKKRHFEEGNFQCNFCNKKFFTPNKLKEHIRIHTGEAPLKCNVCGKGFKRHSNLSEHKKIHEPNREVKPAKELFCHCGKVFKTQRDLDWHREGEHEKVPKKCTYCLEVFVHSSSLTRHIRMKHEGNFMPEGKKTNNYARCPICSQVFYKTSINKHIRWVVEPLNSYKPKGVIKELNLVSDLVTVFFLHMILPTFMSAI